MKSYFKAMVFTFSIPCLAFIGTDSAIMFELITTTASQLNQLEKLVTSTQKHTRKMQKYNELAQDEYFRAERVLYLAESVAAKKEVENLEGFNHAIRDLKYSMSDMRELMKDYTVIKNDEGKQKGKTARQKKKNRIKEKMAISQVNKSINAKTNSRANQLTAQNTAMIYESNVDIHNAQLDVLQKISTTNRLLAEDMEEKRLNDIQKKKFYGLEESN